MTTRRAVVFGAGNIGRGLLGWLFARSGWEVVFLDVSPQVVDLLNRNGSYPVIEVGSDGRSTRTITGVSAVDAGETEQAITATASAELVCTAVGAGVLGRVAPTIATALRREDSRIRNVLACENADPNTALLRQHIESLAGGVPQSVGFPETLVDRMVPGSAGGGLSLEVESRFEFKVARGDWMGVDPGIAGFELVPDLRLHRMRKLWLVNGLHAAAAFLGLEAGHETVAQSVSDPSIHARLEEIAETMAEVLASQVDDWQLEELVAYGRSNLDRFAGTALVDPIRRVARNPLLKLGPDERLVGPARAAARRGLPTEALCEAITAGLALTDDRVAGMAELHDALDAGGWLSVVGLGDADAPLIGNLRARMADRTS
ncbi:MAG: mannitol-1-phosphate 5-dehydrogenase [bacterium]|nr:mannitol-1-phosphate 5-dehydrogenase [bacterium]